MLLAMLVFILLLSMIAVSLLFRSQGDEMAGQAIAGSEQAWSAAMSGIEEAIRVAAAAPPGSTDWQDDPSLFRAREVYQDGADQWFFTVFSPADSDSLADVRYGLSDEASRLNLNHPREADLTKVPGLTPTLADALRQFIGHSPIPADPLEELVMDPTAPPPESEPAPEPTPESAPAADLVVSEVGPILSTSAIPFHGPLATLDELLLVPGFTWGLLHGAPSTAAASLLSPTNTTNATNTTNGDGPQIDPRLTESKRSRGLDQYFTLFSRDPNRSSQGQPRCNLNDPESPWPAVELPASFSNYVAAARAAKYHFVHCSEALEATFTTKDEKGAQTQVSSGITKENLPLLLDLFGTDAEKGHDGLVNVNTASAAVLATLPGIDLPLAEAIVSARTGLSPERRTSIAWLYQEEVVDAARFKTIAPSLTARSTQFGLTVVGYGLPSGRYRVLEAVIDLEETEPRIVCLRDITRRGLPINLKEENMADPDWDFVSAPGRRRDGETAKRRNGEEEGFLSPHQRAEGPLTPALSPSDGEREKSLRAPALRSAEWGVGTEIPKSEFRSPKQSRIACRGYAGLNWSLKPYRFSHACEPSRGRGRIGTELRTRLETGINASMGSFFHSHG